MSEDDISMGQIGGLLADIREMFPVPECGSELEVSWANAMATPEAVPAYVKACIESLLQQIAECEREMDKAEDEFYK